jgi:nitrogen regulatory protein P-II 1
MELLVIVLNKTEYLTEILHGFVEIGIKGATVIDSAGMGHLVADLFPFFSSFADLRDEKENHSKTIFTVVNSCNEKDNAVKVVEEVLGDITKPNTAFMFSVPVNFVKGITINPCEV